MSKVTLKNETFDTYERWERKIISYTLSFEPKQGKIV